MNAGSLAPVVSLIVTTHNRRESLDRLCATLAEQDRTGPAYEIVVTVDGSTDGTVEMLAGWTKSLPIRVLIQDRRGPAAGRNRGVADAGGDVLVFLDDDVIPLPGLVERHLEIHRSDPAAVAIGPMLPPRGWRLPAWLRWEALTLQKQYDAMLRGDYAPTPRQFYTANASVRREHAIAIGGFDETFTRAEDVELAYRLADRGLRFVFVPDAAVIHDPGRTWQGWQEVAREYGRRSVIFERDRGRSQLSAAYAEWGARHPLNRWLAQACVGHPVRSDVLRRMAGVAARHDGGSSWNRIQMGLCSAVYSAAFWQGVADETGLGRRVWAGRAGPSKAVA